MAPQREIGVASGHARTDAAWDDFLDQAACGQFQQSSAWARTKAVDGWRAERRFFDLPQGVRGGCQLLWKPTRLGRIGYVSKGPVLSDESDAVPAAAVAATVQAARRGGIRALILQPPDRSRIGSAQLAAQGFEPWPVESVIRSTAMVDLTGGRAAIEGRMDANRRYELRAAARRGVAVRWGGASDLATFFTLMRESCRRQNSAPNPSSLAALEAMWQAFRDRIFLGLAEHEGRSLAGLLLVRHRDRLTLWKKGWNEQGANLYANSLLNAAALFRGAEMGCHEADFVGLAFGTAQALQAGRPLTEEQRRSRDMFNLKFGAEARLLPPAHLLVTSPVLRIVFRCAWRVPVWRAKLLGRLGSA